MTNLYRLVYTSVRKSSCSDEEIEKILDSCKKNNPSRDVTGILMHKKNRFIQYVEGSKENVELLYDKIKDDPRHTAVNQRCFERIEQREFPSWEMGYKNLTGDLQFQTQTQANKDTFDKIMDAKLDFDNEGLRLLQLFFNN
ncbi:MAG: BLUF domain-containing protein [Ekhidna sp.]|nr:BLUF domain-containing protein [Ekhidna sp.]